jgi:signal transduction histidine kinase
MKSASRQLSRVVPMLSMLCAAGPAFAGTGRVQGLTGAALLWLLVSVLAFRLLRSNLRHHERLGVMEARLAEERKARAATEQALADSHGIVCRLVLEQAGVRDAERSRIARDIHDDLGQNLLALRIDLSLMQVATNGIHPAIHHKVGLMASNLDLAIRSLRAVINNLRPLALGEGLQCAMQRQLAEFTRLWGIEHSFEAADSALAGCGDGLDRDAILYRVLQESLSNVARHARASRVCVTLKRDGDRLTLRVQDDGVGIGGPAGPGRFGLAGMRERALAGGGELVVTSAPGAGTAIELSIPALPLQPAPTSAS